MRKESIILITALLAMVNSTLQAANVRYNVTDLGTLEGYEYTHPLSINNNGQIVGEAVNLFTDYTVHSRGVLFDPTGAKNNIDLGQFSETKFDRPIAENRVAINNHGQIVGGALPFEVKQSAATIFDANGGGNNIEFGIPSSATSINDYGQIVGCVITSANDVNVPIAALFGDFPSDYTNLGTLPGCTHSCAYSINNSGQIIGISYIEDGDSYATLFDPTGDGNNINLSAPGESWSTAIAINDSGTIIGWVENYENPRRAFIFDPTGQGNNIDLGTLEGCDFTTACSINNNGQIVGFAFSTINPVIDTSAVLFDSSCDGNNVNLNDLINPNSGWYLNGAIAINDNGWIAGWGDDPNGCRGVFLLTTATPGDFEPDRDVDAEDFAVLAAAWRSTPADGNWNPDCDISEPSDNVIDEKDLKIFTENWLSDI